MKEPRSIWPDGVRLEKALITDILGVCLGIADDQRWQWEVMEGEPFDAEEVVIRMVSSPGPKWALVDANGVAMAVGGFFYVGPGVWQDWLLTTDRAWSQHPVTCTKAAREMLTSLLEDDEVHRVQAMVLANRTKVREWYRLVGYEYEGTLRGYAASGDDVVIYGRVEHG